MRYFVTGATGFVAGELAKHLIDEGHEVVALARNPQKEKAKELAAYGITIAAGDVTDKASLLEPMQGCEVVFHLAAAQHEANVPDSYFREINVDGTRNMLDAAIEVGVKRFVHASTIGVFGSGSPKSIDENTPEAPAEDNIYTNTKYEAEKLVREYGEAGKLSVTVIRPAETYGPGDLRLLKLYKQINKGTFFKIGPGKNLHHLIYIDDLVDGYMRAAHTEEAEGEIFVLAGADQPTSDEMLEIIADELDKSLLPVRVPLWVFDTAAVVMESTLSPLGIQPPLHRRRMDFFKKNFMFSTAHAEKTLGFDPQVTFKEGAAHTATWYKERGYI